MLGRGGKGSRGAGAGTGAGAGLACGSRGKRFIEIMFEENIARGDLEAVLEAYPHLFRVFWHP